MPSHVRPRHVNIFGHPTSVRLERPFWFWLRIIAAECGMSAQKFIENIRLAHPDAPLSSTLRVEIANYFYSQLPRVGYIDPHSRVAFSVEKPSAGQRAEEAVRANPGRSDRAIAAAIGVARSTIAKARRSMGKRFSMQQTHRQERQTLYGKKHSVGYVEPSARHAQLISVARDGAAYKAFRAGR
jgi:predicted DNA-binding ribbon-helix-helix protein